MPTGRRLTDGCAHVGFVKHVDRQFDTLWLKVDDERLAPEHARLVVVVHLDPRLALVVFEQHAVAGKDTCNLVDVASSGSPET